MGKGSMENIGVFGYPWTVLTGKNIQFHDFSSVPNGNTVKGDFIVTVGKRAIIVTHVKNGKREPIIVKRWRRTEKIDGADFPFGGSIEYPIFNQEDAHFIVEFFIDSEHNEWNYYHSDSGLNIVNCKDSAGNLIYELI